MRKRDLQTGMTVRLRNNKLYLVMLNCCVYCLNPMDLLVSNEGYLNLSSYASSMLINEGRIEFRKWDIIEVFKSDSCANVKNQNRLISIWKREEF